MENYELLVGSADCFTPTFVNSGFCPILPLQELDTVLTGALILLLFVSVCGNCLVTSMFRVYQVIKTDASVSHVCLAQLALSDLIYSVVATPLSLSFLLAKSRYTLKLSKKLTNI